MPEKYKKLIQRYGHGAASVTVNSDCVEVILFGGKRKFRGSLLADPVVLTFGECNRVLGMDDQNDCGLYIADLVILRFGDFH